METQTLITAMERIWKVSSKSKLSEEFFDSIKNETTFVGSLLKTSPVQSVLLSILLDNGCEMSLKQIGVHLDCSNIKMMSYEHELNDLHRRWMLQWIISDKHSNGNCNYAIRQELLKAIKENTPFEPPVFSKFTTFAVLEQLGKWLRMIEADKTLFPTVYESMVELLNATKHLPLSQTLLELELSKKEKTLLIVALWNLVINNKRTLKIDDFQKYWFAQWTVTPIINEVSDGTSHLVDKNLMENYMEEGMSKTDTFKLTDHAINTMLHDTDFQLKKNVISNNTMMNMLQPDTITYKPIYLNEPEQNSIQCLRHLLQQEQFKKIQLRLTVKNMRKGFTCLFYGCPGTGKTESALQLCKATGRDVIMVDAAEMKSKWFGESEKQIKQLFSEYEEMVKSYDVCPVLLFNEADAVINKRTTNIEDIGSKTENTCQNIILQAMENFSGIMIATTNLTENLDTAFERRFLYKIEFKKPELAVKQQIWQSMIPCLSDNEAHQLSNNFDFSGGQIENITRKTIINNVLYDRQPVFSEIEQFCKEEDIKSNRPNRIGF